MRGQRAGAVRREIDQFTEVVLARELVESDLEHAYTLGVLHGLCWVTGELVDPPSVRLPTQFAPRSV